MRHVGLQDHRAPSGERGGIRDVGAQFARRFDLEAEPLGQLAKEIAGALRTATVLAEHLDAVLPQFEHREAMAANRHDGGGGVAEQKTVGPGLGLLGRHARQPDQAAQPTAHRGARQCGPIEFGQSLNEARSRLFAVFEMEAAGPPPLSGDQRQLDQLDALSAQVQTQNASGHLLTDRGARAQSLLVDPQSGEGPHRRGQPGLLPRGFSGTGLEGMRCIHGLLRNMGITHNRISASIQSDIPICGTSLSQRWNAEPAGCFGHLVRMLENQAVAQFQAAGTGPAKRHTWILPVQM